MTDGRLSIAVVGLGYWGPNLARNLAAIPGCELAWLCDADERARTRIGGAFPAARITGSFDECRYHGTRITAIPGLGAG